MVRFKMSIIPEMKENMDKAQAIIAMALTKKVEAMTSYCKGKEVPALVVVSQTTTQHQTTWIQWPTYQSI